MNCFTRLRSCVGHISVCLHALATLVTSMALAKVVAVEAVVVVGVAVVAVAAAALEDSCCNSYSRAAPR